MEVVTHTTPSSRQELRTYLRNRRLVSSIHQTITIQALNDLEEALRLLRGVRQEAIAWSDYIDAFLAPRIESPKPDPPSALPGLLDER
jgi:hypothetical protein